MSQRQAECAFFPMPQSPLGLLLTEDDEGRRATTFIDGDYLRLLIAGSQTETGIGDFDFPETKRLYASALGWPEDWTPTELAQACRMAAECIEYGWDALKSIRDEATRAGSDFLDVADEGDSTCDQ